MSRTATLDRITAKLASFDDERLSAVAEIVTAMDEVQAPVRPLSPRELKLLEQSKADFAAGRACTHAELTAMLDERLAKCGVPKSTT